MLEQPAHTPARRRLPWVLALYFVALHAALVFVCLKTNFRTLSAKTLGLEPPEERSIGLYQHMLPWAQSLDGVGERTVAVVGDSIVKGLDPNAISDHAVVLAAGGMTLPVLCEASGLLAGTAQARRVVLCVGVNDLKYRAPTAVLADYRTLLSGLDGSAPVLCLSVLPLLESVPATHGRSFISNAEIAEFNDLLKAELDGSDRFRFIDIRGAVRDRSGALDPGAFGDDGWHLSAAGRARLAAAIRAQL